MPMSNENKYEMIATVVNDFMPFDYADHVNEMQQTANGAGDLASAVLALENVGARDRADFLLKAGEMVFTKFVMDQAMNNIRTRRVVAAAAAAAQQQGGGGA